MNGGQNSGRHSHALKDGSNQITYMSLLTFLIGILVPSPKMSD
jgi:hypothetical protein